MGGWLPHRLGSHFFFFFFLFHFLGYFVWLFQESHIDSIDTQALLTKTHY